jgi:triacylglycerol lipase
MRSVALALLAASLSATLAGCSRSSHDIATASVAAPATTAPVPVTATAPTGRSCWPIVLVHGDPGFTTIGPIDYFFEIPATLAQDGFQVFVPDPRGDTIAERARSLADQILAKYPDPATRVNVVAHSAGGIDIRYAISTLGLGAKVASATTLAAPHRGCRVNDLSVAIFPASMPGWLTAIVDVVGFDTDPEFTTGAMATFNQANADDPRVAYFSWAGVADPRGTTGCVVDPLFLLSWSILDATEGPSDGVVSVESARWGTFRGTVPADHLNIVGQPLGLTAPGFDHRRFYENLAEDLERRGFGP